MRRTHFMAIAPLRVTTPTLAVYLGTFGEIYCASVDPQVSRNMGATSEEECEGGNSEWLLFLE